MKPLSTYRVQLNRHFDFHQAEQLVDYWDRLGISHLYCSPILTPRPGSLHGYDTCDHSLVNPELGGEEAFRKLCTSLKKRGMGAIVDFVPNHMAADPMHNLWWRDVLANGPSSAHSHYFDIDWDPAKPELKNRVLLPILGAQYGEVLESGHLRVKYSGGLFRLQYWDNDLPLNPRQVRLILRHRLDDLRALLGEDSPPLSEFLSILFQLDHLPAYTDADPESRADRRRETEVARERLARLEETSPEVHNHIARNLEEFNGTPGDPSSFDLLHELLEAQAYRLAYWRTALHEINYRRFFDINELAALRMEDHEVFERTHERIFALIDEGLIDGIRLDHVDGLYDPAGYCRRLRDRTGPDFYIVVEKILSGNEPLDEKMSVDGTTGYGALNALNGVFVNSHSAALLRRVYAQFTGRSRSFEEEVLAAKQLIISSSLASELNMLAQELNRMSEGSRRHRDFTLDSLQEALREVVVSFRVYRTYITGRGVGEQDQLAVIEATRDAIRRNPALDSTIFDFVRENLLWEPRSGESEEERTRRLRFAMKFQQFTAPVQAKGVEDTAFYRYFPMVSLNEVGGEPDRFGVEPAMFHEGNTVRQAGWQHALVATATHDTKRGEDARARINVLSEMPEHWRARLRQWSQVNLPAKRQVNGALAPDRNDEYLYYQALLGSWPAGKSSADKTFCDRMKLFMGKAVKEAKIHTSWINPSNEYDAAVAHFVEETLQGSCSRQFMASFVPFARTMERWGARNSLAQLVLKCMAPGVPDFYQGTELWDLSLVDPDNRRPVDFEARKADGQAGVRRHPKLALMITLLNLRKAKPSLFLQGDYLALEPGGEGAASILAFARCFQGDWLVTIATRFTVATGGIIPPACFLTLPTNAPSLWRNLQTGVLVAAPDMRLPCAEALRGTPAAVLLPA